jgi:uncharacterized protein (DUF169 family)
MVTGYRPTEKMMEELGITELPAIVALFPDSTNIDEGYEKIKFNILFTISAS